MAEANILRGAPVGTTLRSRTFIQLNYSKPTDEQEEQDVGLAAGRDRPSSVKR
jgi:hypothetical protein